MSIVPNATENHDDNDLAKLKADMLAHFKCQKSGNCCRCPGVVYASQSEISSMAKIVDKSELEFRNDYIVKRNGWDVIADTHHRPNCFLTTANECSVYEARPKACRTYPDWPDIWKAEERILKECELCPGLKAAWKKVFKSV
jgi:Fe-S-cluster containining protein